MVYDGPYSPDKLFSSASLAETLTSIIERMCREYDRDQLCDGAVINGLIEEAGEVIGYWSRQPVAGACHDGEVRDGK